MITNGDWNVCTQLFKQIAELIFNDSFHLNSSLFHVPCTWNKIKPFVKLLAPSPTHHYPSSNRQSYRSYQKCIYAMITAAAAVWEKRIEKPQMHESDIYTCATREASGYPRGELAWDLTYSVSSAWGVYYKILNN